MGRSSGGSFLSLSTLPSPCRHATESHPAQPSAGHPAKAVARPPWGREGLGAGRQGAVWVGRAWLRGGRSPAGRPLLTHLVHRQVGLQLQHLLQRLRHHRLPLLQELLLCRAQAEAQPHVQRLWAMGTGDRDKRVCRRHRHEDMALGSVGRRLEAWFCHIPSL